MSPLDDPLNELSCYTLTHGDPAFLHQHVVDAAAAQNADENTKPIYITFALLGLYLHLERHFTGRQVQLAHMALGKTKHRMPTFPLPADRGAITAADVMAALPAPNATGRSTAGASRSGPPFTRAAPSSSSICANTAS